MFDYCRFIFSVSQALFLNIIAQTLDFMGGHYLNRRDLHVLSTFFPGQKVLMRDTSKPPL